LIVTGVQTCALPILCRNTQADPEHSSRRWAPASPPSRPHQRGRMATEPMRVEHTVPASRRRSGDSPLSARYSIRVRLPLLISALLAGTVATFLWAAYREVEATLVRAGTDRAEGAAVQVANLL